MTAILTLLFMLAATEPPPHRAAAVHYVAVNPLAAAAWINSPVTRGNAPLVTHLESGAAASYGRRLSDAWIAEMRVSAGPVNQAVAAYQAQPGLHWFPASRLRWSPRALYAGFAVRVWDLHYLQTAAHYWHAAPMVHAGYMLHVHDGWFLDGRVSQMVGVFAMPAQNGAGGGFAWLPSASPKISPVLPTVLGGVGYRF